MAMPAADLLKLREEGKAFDIQAMFSGMSIASDKDNANNGMQLLDFRHSSYDIERQDPAALMFNLNKYK